MKLSIVIPSLNQGEFLERCLKSIETQNYPFLELVIVDGGSSDCTHQVVEKYRGLISTYVSEPDSGQSEALNKGFSLVTGDIYGWMNADDTYLPGAFQTIIKCYSEAKEALIVFGDWLEIDVDDKLIRRNFAFDFCISHLKYEGFHINSQAMFWKSECHRTFSGFNSKLKYTMDYQLLIEFGINYEYRFHRIEHPLAAFRRHPLQKTQQMTREVINEHKIIAETYGFSDKYKLKGEFIRVFYRFRRVIWYIRRAGVIYMLTKAYKSFINLIL